MLIKKKNLTPTKKRHYIQKRAKRPLKVGGSTQKEETPSKTAVIQSTKTF